MMGWFLNIDHIVNVKHTEQCDDPMILLKRYRGEVTYDDEMVLVKRYRGWIASFILRRPVFYEEVFCRCYVFRQGEFVFRWFHSRGDYKEDPAKNYKRGAEIRNKRLIRSLDLMYCEWIAGTQEKEVPV